MAFFNAPVKREDHAAAAVAAALELRASIGIATGYARVGRLGSDDVKDYTAIGDVVNQAARLQAQARAGEVLVCAHEARRRFPPFGGARVPRRALTGAGPSSAKS